MTHARSASPTGSRRRSWEADRPGSALDVWLRLRSRRSPGLLLDPYPGSEDGWRGEARLALEPTLLDSGRTLDPPDACRRLAMLARRVASRVGTGGRETGIAALIGYEALHPGPRRSMDRDVLPDWVVLAVDRSLTVSDDGRRLTLHASTEHGETSLERLADGIRARLDRAGPGDVALDPLELTGAPFTTLPRDSYLAAVRRLQHHIGEGDIYQGNLTQTLRAGWRGDPLSIYAGLAARAAAPRAAVFTTGGLTMLSVSPETFLTEHDGVLETLPIKGTRRRRDDPVADARVAAELESSPKDRAELLMIVDLERNDLGRVCRTGTISVPELMRLRSYSAVHHLVARVRGVRRAGADVRAVLEATFPGGSISGAPKRRAIELLREVEPSRRNFFTGSLLWFGDDGSIDSSILIRTMVFDRDHVHVGAGGGIVADSDPAAEWCESNDKARMLTHALGFEPEDAG